MQPLTGFSEAAERKEMKPGDRRFGDRGRRPQAAQDIVRSVVHQQAAEAADVFAHRPQRVSDATAQGKLGQRRGRSRTSQADMDGNVEIVRLEFLEPGKNRSAFEAELGNEIDANARSASPIALCRERRHRLLGAEMRMALRMSREADRTDAMRLDRA